jgi:hypothetical protein
MPQSPVVATRSTVDFVPASINAPNTARPLNLDKEPTTCTARCSAKCGLTAYKPRQQASNNNA